MKTDTKRTKPTPRARRMWANYYRDASVLHETRKMAALCIAQGAMHKVIPVAVIPLDDVETLVHCAAEAYFNAWNSELATRKEAMTAALTAIGVLPKQRKGGAK